MPNQTESSEILREVTIDLLSDSTKAACTLSPHDMNRQECHTKRIDSICEVTWIPLCARDGSVIEWGRGEGKPCRFMSCRLSVRSA